MTFNQFVNSCWFFGVLAASAVAIPFENGEVNCVILLVIANVGYWFLEIIDLLLEE